MISKEAKEKAKKLVAQMTIEEKMSQLLCDSPSIPRLNIPAYNWWNESLHGVARAGTATSFPQAIGLSATFDEELLEKVGDIIATEGRAKYNAYSAEDDRDIYKGLTFWAPNLNIFRDPRWGRGHETYGEDPYLTASLGVAYIKGIQGDQKIMKSAACAKHFAVHSGPEDLRHVFDAKVSPKDFAETYLPAFKAAVSEAEVAGVMGAYNRINGEAACGSKTLIRDMIRDQWGFEGYFVSDCWALRDFHENHKITSDATHSAALALKSGCDINCGYTYRHIADAFKQGLVTEDDITEAVEHLFAVRFALGLFEETEFDKIPYTVVECRAHLELAQRAARESLVLLKNDRILPLDTDNLHTIGVIGPNANSREALIGNYHGTSSEYITLLEGLQRKCPEHIRLLFSEGAQLSKARAEQFAHENDRLSEAIIVCKHSDVVILCVGLNETLEGEEGDEGNEYQSGDKKSLFLPESQLKLLEAVAQTGVPVVLCLMAGSDIDLKYANENFQAILQCWYPGARGGLAIAEALFGEVSPSGKLSVTFYEDPELIPAFVDYSMKGRTYRYIENEAQYPFGYGLTYGDVQIMNAVYHEDAHVIDADVMNTGNCATGDVIQVYVENCDSVLAPLHPKLCGYSRVFLNSKERKSIRIQLDHNTFMVVDENGNWIEDGENYKLYVGISQPDAKSLSLTGKQPIQVEVCRH